jgi:hypothetical protein
MEVWQGSFKMIVGKSLTSLTTLTNLIHKQCDD